MSSVNHLSCESFKQHILNWLVVLVIALVVVLVHVGPVCCAFHLNTYTPLCFIKSLGIKQFVRECECLGMMDGGLNRAVHNLRNLTKCLT